MSITRVELAKRYIKKTKLINSGLKLVLDENNDTVILDGVIGNGDKLVIPEFINDINIRVGSNSKGLLSHNGPLNGSTYKEVKIECDLESYEYLFNGVVADKLVVDMSSCKSVKRLDLMFKGACVSSISVIGLEDKHIENMSSMFSYCKELEDVDISGINLKYVKSMDNLFEGCEMLERVNFGVGNTESLMYMSKMFRNCSKLSEIDISMLKKIK